MADAASEYVFARVRDHLLGVSEFAKPSAIYLALITADGAEVSGGGYERVACGPGDANWSAPSGGTGTTSNLVAFAFPAPAADWGRIVSAAIFDAPDRGAMLVCTELAVPRVVRAGDVAPTFAPASLTFAPAGAPT